MPHHLLLTAAATLSLVVAFLKPYFWYLALAGLSLILAHRSQIDAWAEANPRLAGVLKLIRALGFDPWMLVQALSLLVKKRLPDVQVAGSKSMRPPPVPPLPMLALCVLLPLSLLGCGAATPEAKGALAANEARLGYSAAAVVVTELAKLDADWMASLQDPEAAKAALPAAQKIGAALDAATASLKVVRSYLTDGGDAAKARTELTNALMTSEDLLELLAEVGKKPPPAVLDAIGYLHGFLLGGGS